MIKKFLLLLFVAGSFPCHAVDLVVFSYNRPMQLYALLESVDKYFTGIDSTHVIYRTSADKFEGGYQKVKDKFNKVTFLQQQDAPRDFKYLTEQATFQNSKSKHVIYAVDDIIVKDYVDLSVCAKKLEEQGAYGCFLRLGKNTDHCYMLGRYMSVPVLQHVGDDLYSYKISEGKDDWSYPNNLDMTIYRKKDVKKFCDTFNFITPNNFEGHWAARANLNQRGLVFAQSKIVNIPVNLVNISSNRNMQGLSVDELLDKFMQGKLIDISKFYQIKNTAPHMDSELEFI